MKCTAMWMKNVMLSEIRKNEWNKYRIKILKELSINGQETMNDNN